MSYERLTVIQCEILLYKYIQCEVLTGFSYCLSFVWDLSQCWSQRPRFLTWYGTCALTISFHWVRSAFSVETGIAREKNICTNQRFSKIIQLITFSPTWWLCWQMGLSIIQITAADLQLVRSLVQHSLAFVILQENRQHICSYKSSNNNNNYNINSYNKSWFQFKGSQFGGFSVQQWIQ